MVLESLLFWSTKLDGKVYYLQVLVVTWLLAVYFIKGFLSCSSMFEMMLQKPTAKIVSMDLTFLRTVNSKAETVHQLLQALETAAMCALHRRARNVFIWTVFVSQQPPEHISKVKDFQ